MAPDGQSAYLRLESTWTALYHEANPRPTPPGPPRPSAPKNREGVSRTMSQQEWTVYLSGEIHSDWRERITEGAKKAGLPVTFVSPVTDHASSDDCGVEILGAEGDSFWHDHKSAKVNAIRTRTLIERADVAVVRFGDKYRQWNAAFDAGYAAALGKPIITLHDPSLTHALKEVDAVALAGAEQPEQVVRILDYAISGELRS
jgi:YtoQ family protein